MPWAAFTVPVPVGTGELVNRSTPSRSRPTADADDVGDAVEGTDLVEVDALERHAVDRRLGLGELAEDAPRQFALLRRQRRLGEDRLDVGQEAVVLLVGGLDGRLGRGEAAAVHPLDLELDRQAERVERSADRVGGHAGVDDGAQDHVAADAAEAVEVCDLHRGPL